MKRLNISITGKLIYTMVIVAAASSLVAQSKKKLVLSECSFFAGMLSENSGSPSWGDFSKLASPGLNLDNKDYSVIAPYGTLTSIVNPGGMGATYTGSPSGLSALTFMLGYQVKRKDDVQLRAWPTLRFGVGYFSGQAMEMGFGKTVRNTYDTYKPGGGTETVFFDSVTNYGLFGRYNTQQIRLDGSLLLSTSPEKRLRFRGGVGFNAGMSLSNQTEIIKTTHIYRENRFGSATGNNSLNDNYYGGDDVKTTTWTQKNKGSFAASVYIPLAVDIKLWRKRDPWNQIHAFYEVRPGINLTTMPELNKTNVFGSVQQGVGFRFQL